RSIRHLQPRDNIEWTMFFHGFVVFVVYGTKSIIDFAFELHRQCGDKCDPLAGALAQFVVFIYVILDVTTVLCIPLSIFVTVPAI
ncbi:hypothetical protein PENTCL1PPCAC_21637, partial [Pristionchus entomophagus]